MPFKLYIQPLSPCVGGEIWKRRKNLFQLTDNKILAKCNNFLLNSHVFRGTNLCYCLTKLTMSERNYKKHIPLHIYCTELDNNNDILLWFRFFALMTPRQGIILKQTQRAGDTKFRIFPNKQKIDLEQKVFDLLKSMYIACYLPPKCIYSTEFCNP